MPSMTALHKGDVVLVPFEFTDRSGTKFRPAVVITSDEYQRTSPDLLLAAVTGNVNALPHPGDHALSDWERAGLRRPSLVQMKVTTVEQGVIQQKLGRLSKRDLQAVEQGLRVALGL